MFTFLLSHCLRSDFNQSQQRNELQMARPSEHQSMGSNGTDDNISQGQGNKYQKQVQKINDFTTSYENCLNLHNGFVEI